MYERIIINSQTTSAFYRLYIFSFLFFLFGRVNDFYLALARVSATKRSCVTISS